MRMSACKGVFVRARRTVQTSRSGASNDTSVGGGDVRFQKVYIVRLYKSLPLLCLYTCAVQLAPSRRDASSSHKPGGWYGDTLAPPISGFMRPLTASA